VSQESFKSDVHPAKRRTW